jgi:hypothetical protein
LTGGFVDNSNNRFEGNVLTGQDNFGFLVGSGLKADGTTFFGETVTIHRQADGEFPDVGVDMRLKVAGFEGVGDYSQTAIVSLTPPPGVTFTSESGQFLKGHQENVVPEPASVTLLGSGLFGLIGCGWRRRRKAGLQS